MLVETAAGLARFVQEIFACMDHILNSLFYDSVVDAFFGPKDESEHIFKHRFWLKQKVLETKKEYWRLILLDLL